MNIWNSKKLSIILIALSCIVIAATQVYIWRMASEPQDNAAIHALPHVSVLGIEPAPVAGIVVNEQLEVVRVEPGSAAQAAGIQIGDKILSIANKDVSNISTLRSAVLNAKNQSDVPDATPILDPDPQKQAAIDAAAAQATQRALIERPNVLTLDIQVMRNNKPLHTSVKFMPQKVVNVAQTPTPVPVQAFYF